MSALIIIPAYSHIDHRLQSVLLETGVPYLPMTGFSDLPRIRSILLTKACEQDVERVLLIDADIVPTKEQVQELATSPLVTPEQALSGFYPIRGGTNLSIHAPEAKELDPFPAEWGGLGFCAIHRESLWMVSQTLPTIQGDTLPWTPFCVPKVADDFSYLADDRSLWWRLATVGVKLVGKRSLHVGHVDSIVRR
jgi:hypothetical protein